MKKILLFIALAIFASFNAHSQTPSINSDSSNIFCSGTQLIWTQFLIINNMTDTGKVIRTHTVGAVETIDTLDFNFFTSQILFCETDINNVGMNETQFVLWDKNFTTAYDTFFNSKMFNNLSCSGFMVSPIIDKNNDCALQQNEYINAPNVALYRNNVLDKVISNIYSNTSSNYFSFTEFALTDTLVLKPHNPIYTTCHTNDEMAFVLDTLTTYNHNFIFKLSDSINWAVQMNPMLRTVAGVSRVQVHYSNLSIDSGDATINFTIPTNFSFDSTTNPNYTVAGNIVTFNISVVPAGYSNSFYIYLMNEDSLMVLGDSVNCHIEILPIVGDVDITNNTQSGYYLLRASYDPNQKTTLPHVLLNEATQTIDYLIEFENLGNDTAFNVSIVDTMSSLLDMKTFTITASSHEYGFSNLVVNGQNILTFDFPNINLGDSSDKAHNKGFIRYSVAPKAGLTHSDTIYNTAHIYFDVNEAIVTNTSENYLKPLSVNNVNTNWNVSVYPNPVQTQLIIENPAFNAATVTVYSIIGQRIMHTTIKRGVNYLDMSKLNEGIYIVECNQDGASKTFKIVKQ